MQSKNKVPTILSNLTISGQVPVIDWGVVQQNIDILSIKLKYGKIS